MFFDVGKQVCWFFMLKDPIGFIKTSKELELENCKHYETIESVYLVKLEFIVRLKLINTV